MFIYLGGNNIKIYIIPSWYKSDSNPLSGNFFYEHARAISEKGIEVNISSVKNFSILKINKYLLESGIQRTYDCFFSETISKHLNLFSGLQRHSINSLFNQHHRLFKEYQMKHGKPDIIHAQCILWGGWIAKKIAELENIPYIVTMHSSKLFSENFREKNKKVIVDILNSAAKVIAVSEALRTAMLPLKKDITVIPNAVDTIRFDVNLTKSNIFTFFSLAFLNKEKNLGLLIESFHEAHGNNMNIKLYIGGNGPEYNYLKQIIYKLNMQSQIKLIGSLNRNEVKFWMEKCDVFVLPSKKETFGIVYIEAMAAGKPVIATKCGGPEEFVETSNGILIENNDSKELTDSLRAIINLKYNHTAIKNFVEGKYSYKAVSQQYKQIYEDVLVK